MQNFPSLSARMSLLKSAPVTTTHWSMGTSAPHFFPISYRTSLLHQSPQLYGDVNTILLDIGQDQFVGGCTSHHNSPVYGDVDTILLDLQQDEFVAPITTTRPVSADVHAMFLFLSQEEFAGGCTSHHNSPVYGDVDATLVLDIK